MDESRAWPRYELIAGELVVTPAPTSVHQIAVMALVILLSAYVERESLGVAFTSPADLELQPGIITQPDVFVVPANTPLAGERLQWTDVKALLLAIEVLSPGTARIDRVEKRDVYLDAAVDEYWIVDLDARVLERWTPEQATPMLVRERLIWNAASNPLVIELPALFERINTKARLLKPEKPSHL
jgi:Uma2 family endonuclease